MKPENKAEARRLLDAVEAERVRQGRLMTQMSGNTEYCPVAYQGALKRGSAFLSTFVAFCRQLDIEIVLVNKEGDAIT